MTATLTTTDEATFDTIVEATFPTTIVDATTDTIVEAITPPPLHVGDTVRASDEATDNHGYNSGDTVRGKIGTLDFFDDYNGWFVRPTDGSYAAYVRVDDLTRVSEADVLREQVERLTTERDAALQKVTTQEVAFERWKSNLQEVAFEAAEDNDMCSVFDEVMEKVGLEGRSRDITVSVNFSGYINVTVEATSEDDAVSKINRAMVVEALAENEYAGSLTFDADPL